jgi:hypothetical protein
VVDLLERDTTGLGVRARRALADAAEDHPRLGGTRGRLAREPRLRQRGAGRQGARGPVGTDVHIVFTARSLTSVAPAAWQERLKNRSDASWADFLAELGDDSWPNPFWRQHGGGALFDWAEGLPPERVHVGHGATERVPPELSGSGSPPCCASTRRPAPPTCRGSNESLGIDEAAFLRLYNAGPGRDLSWPAYRAGVKHGLALVLAQRPDKRRILVTGPRRCCSEPRRAAGAAHPGSGVRRGGRPRGAARRRLAGHARYRTTTTRTSRRSAAVRRTRSTGSCVSSPTGTAATDRSSPRHGPPACSCGKSATAPEQGCVSPCGGWLCTGRSIGCRGCDGHVPAYVVAPRARA